MPLDWSVKNDYVPPMLTFNLQTGIDCGILYFLTDKEEYAQIGADILNTIIEAFKQ
jgi:hypothetical protein